MKLDYATLLCPNPIKLSIGSLIKHTLREIAEISFDKFNLYEAFLKITPEQYYMKFKGNDGKKYWESLSEETKDQLTIYKLISTDDAINRIYIEILNFFFKEYVAFKDGYFILFNQEVDINRDVPQDSICGVINEETFSQVLSLIQQICCIYEEEEAIDSLSFKNSLARKLYEKMLKAQKKEKEQKKYDKNHSIPNIISAVSNCHPTINPVNVWDLTLFQLLDSFNRLRVNKMYDIDARRVSVWGDSKKTFNAALWYKNEFDKS